MQFRFFFNFLNILNLAYSIFYFLIEENKRCVELDSDVKPIDCEV